MEQEVSLALQSGRCVLQGTLSEPGSAQGLVIFAHGSGSSRHSPRNRHVAERIVDLVASRLGRTVPRCRTHNTPLPGAAGVAAGAALVQPAQTREERSRLKLFRRRSVGILPSSL